MLGPPKKQLRSDTAHRIFAVYRYSFLFLPLAFEPFDTQYSILLPFPIKKLPKLFLQKIVAEETPRFINYFNYFINDLLCFIKKCSFQTFLWYISMIHFYDTFLKLDSKRVWLPKIYVFRIVESKEWFIFTYQFWGWCWWTLAFTWQQCSILTSITIKQELLESQEGDHSSF